MSLLRRQNFTFMCIQKLLLALGAFVPMVICGIGNSGLNEAINFCLSYGSIHC